MHAKKGITAAGRFLASGMHTKIRKIGSGKVFDQREVGRMLKRGKSAMGRFYTSGKHTKTREIYNGKLSDQR